ncbi:MAG: glutamate-1-semialdehyde 2,1-aminomutase [Chlamydiales bacterium]|jgi:glutamate-1-semialdehyde 2,1-aminomutase
MTANVTSRMKSEEIYERLCEVIPSGVNSPVRAFSGIDLTPLVVEEGYGDKIKDADGNEYIDYCCSWGALIHGHAKREVLQAVRARMEKGTSFGITSAVEEQLARKVVGHVATVEKIRFVSSGTEATMSAIRLARGFTDRDVIVKFVGNYHGHADHLLVQAGSGVVGITPTSSSKGVPDDFVKYTISLPYNDAESCRQLFASPEYHEKIAAVIVEPVAGNMGVVAATREFLETLRTECSASGALLIFDEVINGFRLSLTGAQGLYGIEPDLTCFGKIVGGGFPAAAFGGRRDIMDYLAPEGPVYQAGTLSGNPVAMEAGLKTLELAEKEGFYEELEEKAEVITKPVREALLKAGFPACVQRVGSMFTIFWGTNKVSNMDDCSAFDKIRFTKFFRFLFERGVYIPPSQYEACFVSSAHSIENLEKTRDLILEFISTCKGERDDNH